MHFGRIYLTLEIALILRNSLLLNGILYSVEAIVKLEPNHVKTLKYCDNYFWQQIYNTPQSAAKEGYHIESCTTPIRFIILGRKFMFLWTLLNKSDEELAKRVLLARSLIKTDNSWVEIIKQDLVRCKINLTFQHISSFTKQQFKTL